MGKLKWQVGEDEEPVRVAIIKSRATREQEKARLTLLCDEGLRRIFEVGTRNGDSFSHDELTYKVGLFLESHGLANMAFKVSGLVVVFFIDEYLDMWERAFDG